MLPPILRCAGWAISRGPTAIMKRGDLVPDALVIAMVRDKIQSPAVAAQAGVLFDGFPRTIPQAEALEKVLAELGRRLGAVLSLEVPDAEIIERLMKRGRADDTLDTVRARLEVYQRQTAPLIDFYRARGALVALNGVGTIEEVTARLRAATQRTRP